VLNWGIEIETPCGIIFLFQSLQPGHPPSVIPVHLSQGLVPVCIVYIRVQLSAPISLMQSLTEAIAKSDSFAVQCAIYSVADDRGSNGLLAVYDETEGRAINIH